MAKSQRKSKTSPFPEASGSPESSLAVVRRLSEGAGVDEDEVHRKMNQVDAQVGQELPKTEDYVTEVVKYIKGQQEVVQDQLRINQEARSRANVLLAVDVLAREYPARAGEKGNKLDVGLEAAATILTKELSLLNGGME